MVDEAHRRLLAEQLKLLFVDVNRAIEECAHAGVIVDVSTLRMEVIGRNPYPTLNLKVSLPL